MKRDRPTCTGCGYDDVPENVSASGKCWFCLSPRTADELAGMAQAARDRQAAQS